MRLGDTTGDITPWTPVRVVIVVRVSDGRWEFRTTRVFDSVVAEILMRDLAAEPVVHVLSAHIEPVERKE